MTDSVQSDLEGIASKAEHWNKLAQNASDQLRGAQDRLLARHTGTTASNSGMVECPDGKDPIHLQFAERDGSWGLWIAVGPARKPAAQWPALRAPHLMRIAAAKLIPGLVDKLEPGGSSAAR